MISAIILTKNEEKNIVDCLESLSWVSEVLVIDDNSDDRTVEIAKTFGAKVFKKTLEGSFAAQRNYGLSKTKGDWVFFVDADERVTDELKNEILSKMYDRKTDGYFLKRKDIIFGKELKYGESANVEFLRLARRNNGLWMGDVHEIWFIKGKTQRLINPLIHYPHQSIAEFLEEINFYTDLRAQELKKKNVQVAWWHVIMYPLGKFVRNYFFRLGILDGLQGLVFAILMSFHSFLVRAKLFLLWQRR